MLTVFTVVFWRLYRC